MEYAEGYNLKDITIQNEDVQLILFRNWKKSCIKYFPLLRIYIRCKFVIEILNHKILYIMQLLILSRLLILVSVEEHALEEKNVDY